MFPVAYRWFEFYGQQLSPKELHPLQGVGLQKCLAFSTDGSKFATGGVVSTLIADKNWSICTMNIIVFGQFLYTDYFTEYTRMDIYGFSSGQVCASF